MAKKLYTGPQTSWLLHHTTDLGELEQRIRAAMTGEGGGVVEVPVVVDESVGTLLLNVTGAATVLVLDTDPVGEGRIPH